MEFSIFLVIFIVLFATIAYVYFGYPALLWLVTRRAQESSTLPESGLPTVSLIIAAHNEASVIEAKLRNTLSLTYPRDRLEIIVASDGSDDGTDDVVRRFADHHIRLHPMSVRRGKMPAISSAVIEATGDILVFSDANAIYESHALERLIEAFQDESVGCVCGKLLYVTPAGTSVSEGEALYWNYENRLKEWESRFNSLVGANGSIYAVRRAAYVPLDSDVSDDYGFPLAAYGLGYRVVYQPSAISREEAPVSLRTEFQKKSRFVAHQLTTLARLWPMLRPFRDPKLLFQLVSHKLLRTVVPFLLVGLFLSNAMLEGQTARLLFWGQVSFYGFAVCGMFLYRWGISLKLFAIPLYFCTVNAAAAVGMFHFFRKKNYAAWDEG